MKKAVYFLLGACAGLITCFLIFYVSGVALDFFGIPLYASEAGQQRNFNLFLLASAICSAIAGVYFVRRFA